MTLFESKDNSESIFGRGSTENSEAKVDTLTAGFNNNPVDTPLPQIWAQITYYTIG